MNEDIRPGKFDWWLYQEREWLKFMVRHHEDTLKHFKKMLRVMESRIARWERYVAGE